MDLNRLALEKLHAAVTGLAAIVKDSRAAYMRDEMREVEDALREAAAALEAMR